MVRGNAAFAGVTLALCVAGAMAKKKGDDDGPGFLSVLLASLLPAVIAVVVGYVIVFPIDFVRASPAFRRRSAGRRFEPIAFFEAVPEALADIAKPDSIELFLQRILLFAPRLTLKLTVYAMVRGRGKGSVGKFVVAATVSALVTLLYAFPFRKAELDHAITTGRFDQLYEILRKKASARGIASLYNGFLAAAPFAVVNSILMFTLMEIVSANVEEKAVMVLVLAAPIAVVGASVLSSPLDQLRQLIVGDPLDVKEFLFGYDSEGNQRKAVNPDWILLKDYVLRILDHWLGRGLQNMFGKVNLSVNSTAVALGLGLHHLMVRPRN